MKHADRKFDEALEAFGDLPDAPRSYQLTETESALFAESGVWEPMTSEERARFQIAQRLLCMPFGVFHQAVEDTLGRSVTTYGFGVNADGLRAELLDGAEPPSIGEILGMLRDATRDATPDAPTVVNT